MFNLILLILLFLFKLELNHLFLFRCVIDLSTLERERTHSLWNELEDGAGSLHLLLTISGTTASETISDLTTYEENPRERENLLNRYVSNSNSY